MKTFLLTLALCFAVIGGAVGLSSMTSTAAHAGTCSDGSSGC